MYDPYALLWSLKMDPVHVVSELFSEETATTTVQVEH